MSADGDSEAGRRSSSPPGRESREDWKKGERQADVSHPADKERSRSRSPRSKSPPFKKAKREPNRGAGGPRFFRDGTNTVRDEPHLQRARLFVGNIEPNKTERKDIIDLFSRHGEVLGVSVHKGYAFVQMDRERNANKAINYEDNQNFLGSRIHVEFSQAALKAGAKFERIPIRESPPRDMRSHQSSRLIQPSLSILEIEREREERLSRILAMERELAMLRSREDSAARRSQQPLPNDAPYDRYEAYRRERSPPRRESEYPSTRDYGHGERVGAGYMARGEDSRGGGGGGTRGYYNGRSTSPIPRGGEGRDPVSYPISGRGGYERRDTSQFSGGASVGYGGYGGGGAAGGGQYGSSGGKLGVGGALPPGWPSTDYDKSNANRPPFSNTSPWS